MALITLRQLLDEAGQRSAAIPSFNVNNLEQVQAILAAAEHTNSPVILQASLGARKYAGMTFLKGLMQSALESYPNLAICIHQDHGHTPGVCFESIQAGFSSVMMDGSLESDGKTPASFESNVSRTQAVTRVAHAIGVSVEGEIGCLGSLETGLAGEEDGSGAEGLLSQEQMLTGVQQAIDFVNLTHVDALAVAIGTSHGAAKFFTPPDENSLALYRLEELYKALPNQHFVMHGSSSVPIELLEMINTHGGDIPISYGVPVSALQKAINMGVRKINIDTDLRLASTGAIRKYFVDNPHLFDPRGYLGSARKAMQTICRERFEAFRCNGWGGSIKIKTFEQMKNQYI